MQNQGLQLKLIVLREPRFSVLINFHINKLEIIPLHINCQLNGLSVLMLIDEIIRLIHLLYITRISVLVSISFNLNLSRPHRFSENTAYGNLKYRIRHSIRLSILPALNSQVCTISKHGINNSSGGIHIEQCAITICY